jgi:uncharacterized protein YndB with AHSA1/START domain
MTRRFAALAGLLLATAAGARAEDRVLRTQLLLDAPLEAVWNAWATEDGVKTFFAPGCHIEPTVDGAYEIFFNPQGEPGQRGAEGLRVLVFEPKRRLAFTWNAPPDQPHVRAQRTVVTLEFEPQGEARTRLTFTHSGWGSGPDWDKAYDYFDRAWGGFVLPNLVQRFAKGPIDWKQRPQPQPLPGTLRVTLAPVAAAP